MTALPTTTTTAQAGPTRSSATLESAVPHFPTGGSPFPPVAQRDAAPPPTAEPVATPYERLPRTLARWSWWRILVALIILGAVTVAGQAVLLLPLLTEFDNLTGMMRLEGRLARFDALDVPVLIMLLGGLAVMIPGLFLGLHVMKLRPVGAVSSVAFRVRWRWLIRCGVVAVAALAFSVGASFALAAISGAEFAPVWTPLARLWLPLLVVLLLVPFQAAAEEYVFRGAMVQALGSWLPQRWWARVIIVVVTTLLFTFSHAYDLWGQLSVGVFALAAVWLTLRTGGLEAAIALHVVNNLVAFGLQASGIDGTTEQSTDGGSLVGLVIALIMTLGYVLVVEALATRHRISRTSPWPQRGGTPPAPVAQPYPVLLAAGGGQLEPVGGPPVYPGR